MKSMTHPSATLTPTQRRITLLRHAKAEPDRGGDDHARALAPAGRDQAAALGLWLHERTLQPQRVLCSTAMRTRETLALLELSSPAEFMQSLYLASAGDMLAMVQNCDDAVHHLCLIGHNPGMHGLAALLAGEYVREADADQLASRYPTCGLVSLVIDTPWAQLAPQVGTVDLVHFGSSD